MKKMIILLVILLFPMSCFSQNIYIGAMGGMTTYISPDELTSSLDDGGYGLTSGFTYGIIGKINPKKTRMSFTYRFTISKFHNEARGYDIDQDMLTVGSGYQVSPFTLPGGGNFYFEMGLFYCHIGKIGMTRTKRKVVSEYLNRYGFGVGIGAEYPLNNRFFLDGSIKYNFNNVSAREIGEETYKSTVAALGILYKIY